MLPARLLLLCTCLYSNTNQPLECAQNKPWRNNCCRGRIMAARSEGLDYFALGGLVDYLCSSCLTLKMDHQSFVFWPLRRLHSVHKTVALGWVVPPERHLKLENVLLQAMALECGALRLIRGAFSNDACYILGLPMWKINLRISNNLYHAHEELTDA